MHVQAAAMAGKRAPLCFFLICLSSTILVLGAAQDSSAFQSLLSGLLPSDAAAINPFLSVIGSQLSHLPSEAEKQATLCSIISEKQLPIKPSFCTTPPPAGQRALIAFHRVSIFANIVRFRILHIPSCLPACHNTSSLELRQLLSLRRYMT